MGPYRYVRNPMMLGVFLIGFAESILFLSSVLIIYFITFMLLNLIYIPLFEEKGLTKRFGNDYELYKKNVPR